MSASLPPRPDLPVLSFPAAPGAAPEEGTPRATWRWWEVILLYLAGQIVVGGVVTSLLNPADLQGPNGGATGLGIAAAMLTEIIVTATLILWLRSRHPGWLRSVGFPSRSRAPREAGVGILLGLALYPAVSIVGGILTAVFQSAIGRGVQPPEQLSTSLGTGGAILAATYALAIAPFAEEFFFRGLLFRSLRDRYGFWPGALVSSVAFGLVHYVPAPWQDAVLLQTIMVFTGFGLALIYERRGNLVANWAAHVTFNAIGLVAILALGFVSVR
jgi:membrane protease YdiL (CAAX protease family)